MQFYKIDKIKVLETAEVLDQNLIQLFFCYSQIKGLSSNNNRGRFLNANRNTTKFNQNQSMDIIEGLLIGEVDEFIRYHLVEDVEEYLEITVDLIR